MLGYKMCKENIIYKFVDTKKDNDRLGLIFGKLNQISNMCLEWALVFVVTYHTINSQINISPSTPPLPAA